VADAEQAARPGWRQGTKVPHHVYRQRGPEPDTRAWPDGDEPVATFLDPIDAAFAVSAVNDELHREGAEQAGGEPRRADALVDAITAVRQSPGGQRHWATEYHDDGEPYGELCWCTDSDGEDH
jgi:hypothetical protein